MTAYRPLPPRRPARRRLGVGGVLAVIGVVLLAMLGPSALCAWLIMLGLGALGVNVGFLPVWALTAAAGMLIGLARSGS